jgi:hypothetical protein
MSSLFQPTTPSELGPKLANANFTKANLSGVSFKRDSNTKLVDTSGTCFEGATLDGADISGFDLHNVLGLAVEQIDKANADHRPQIPAGYLKKKCVDFTQTCPNTEKPT